MTQKTPLYAQHVEAGGKIVDFAGWELPVNYGSQVQEHNAVRTDAGLFDVSHMVVSDLTGDDAQPFLRHLLANDVARLTDSGKALYSCMLNERGGVIDDLIVYFLKPTHYRVITNAATRDKDLAWIQQQAANFNVNLQERPELAMLAAQGPNAREKAVSVLPASMREAVMGLSRFSAIQGDNDLFVARTGYTGEDGFEIILPADQAAELWGELVKAGISPCGLGARDTLRLEAGMALYGSDMDEDVSPLEAGLAWTVAWEPEDRDFIGRQPLVAMRGKAPRKQVSLVMEGKGVLRNHQPVLRDGKVVGEITSGGFAPTLNVAIAMARVEAGDGEKYEVEIRGKTQPVRLVKAPFVRNGRSMIEDN